MQSFFHSSGFWRYGGFANLFAVLGGGGIYLFIYFFLSSSSLLSSWPCFCVQGEQSSGKMDVFSFFIDIFLEGRGGGGLVLLAPPLP